MVWETINYIKEKIFNYTGLLRLVALILAPFILSVILLLAEWSAIDLSVYFRLVPEKASPHGLFLCFIINLIVSYSFILYTIARDQEHTVLVKYNRAEIDLRKMLSRARKKINLVGISLKPFATENIINEMNRLVEKDVKIRILLLNPFTITAAIRSDSLYPGKSNLTTQIIDAIVEFTDLAHSIKQNNYGKFHNFEIRIYSGWPTASVFIMDDLVNFSTYVENKTGINSPYFLFYHYKNKNLLYDVVQNHFDSIWSSGINILKNDWINKAKAEAHEQIQDPDRINIIESRLRR